MTAKIISLAQAKGGAGKSTLCANLASTLCQSAKVLMIDCDPPQNSLSAWFQVRDDLYVDTGLTAAAAATPAQLHSLIDKNKSNFDYILIDGAPHINAMARAMLLASNLVLVPLSPSPVEIWSYKSFEALVSQAMKINKQLKAKVVWNRVRKRVKSGEEIIANHAKDSKIGAFKNQLTYRVAYMDSFAEGLSVFEWNDNVASAEIWSLSSAIKRLLQKEKQHKLPHSAAAQTFIKKG